MSKVAQAPSLDDTAALVATLAAGNGRVADGPLDEEAVSRLVLRLRRNKFPLLALESAIGNGSPFERSRSWRAALEEDAASYKSLRDEYIIVKRAWEAVGIPCIAFKSAGTYPAFPYTSDNLDLLVPRDRCRQAKAILQELGYVWLRNIDETQKFLFRKFNGGRSVSAIHVHSWVGWDVEFHEDVVWEGARPSQDDAEVLVPAPEDAILINVAHAFYENKQFSLYDLDKVRSQWARADLDWHYLEGVARRRGWLDGLYFGLLVCAHLEKAIYGETGVSNELLRRWEDGLRGFLLSNQYWRRIRRRPVVLPFPVFFPFSKLLYYRKILRDRHDPFRRRLSNLCHTLVWGLKLKSGIRPQPGMLVTFSGIDGAGKTAHARALSEALTISEIANRLVWSRCGCSPAYRALSKLGQTVLPKAKGIVTAANPPDSRRSARRGPLAASLRFLWSGLNVFDLVLVYLLRVRLPLLRGRVVICDRYIYDAAVELAHRLPPSDRLSRLPLRLLIALSPKPRAGYLLDLTGAIAGSRSRDAETESELEQQRQRYLEMARPQGLRVRDASTDFLTLNDALVREVLSEYEDGYATFLNGLLLSNPGQLNREEMTVAVSEAE